MEFFQEPLTRFIYFVIHFVTCHTNEMKHDIHPELKDHREKDNFKKDGGIVKR